MTLNVEEIVNRGMNSGEFLQRLKTSEARHQPLSSSKRLVRVFGTIVEPAAEFVAICNADSLHRRAI